MIHILLALMCALGGTERVETFTISEQPDTSIAVYEDEVIVICDKDTSYFDKKSDRFKKGNVDGRLIKLRNCITKEKGHIIVSNDSTFWYEYGETLISGSKFQYRKYENGIDITDKEIILKTKRK